MKKKLLTGIVLATLLIISSGCNKNNDNINTKAKCKIFECINKIEPENTPDEINKIIGFKGEITDEKYKIYQWILSDDEYVQVAYYSSDTSQIKIKYNKDDLINKKVDLSDFENIKEDLKKGVKITYNDLTKMFKSEGTLVGKSKMSKKYTWVSENGSYLTATIDNKNERCTLLTGKVR